MVVGGSSSSNVTEESVIVTGSLCSERGNERFETGSMRFSCAADFRFLL